MKRKYSTSNRVFNHTISVGCVAAVCMLPIQGFAGVTEAPAAAAEEPEPASNWVEFTAGGVSVNGDKAAFQRRVQQNGDFYGGISSMRYEQEANDITWTLEGHALFGNEDYEIILGAEKIDLGYLKAGFRQFNTWYDGSGGYAGSATAPPNDWIEFYNDDFELERGELWLEAGLRMPDLPEITFAYSHRWREGLKDSTSWATSPASRANIPSFYGIDEVTDLFKIDVRHTIDNTLFGGGFRYNRTRNDDTRNLRQGGPTQTNNNNDRVVSQLDVFDMDLFSGHLFSESWFGQEEKLMLSLGYAFTTIDTDMDGGYRISIDRDGDLRTSSDHSYFDMLGGTQAKSHVISSSVWWNPVKDLVIAPSARVEWWDQSAWGSHVAGIRTSPDGVTEFILDMSDYEWLELAEQVEVRYDGISNLLLYAKAEWSQSDGEWSKVTVVDGDVDGTLYNDSEIDKQKYTAGANWYPMRNLSLAAQYYYSTSDQDFDPVATGGEDAQLKSHDRDVNDLNLRATWRAMPNLTFVTRYDYRHTEIGNQAFSGLPSSTAVTAFIESGDIVEHIISESVTWNVNDSLYLQGSFNYISSETDTPSNERAGLDPGYVVDWQNDYWSASLSAGYALTRNTDLQASYYYYSADNYVNNSALSMPYGTIATEHAFSVGLVHRINPNMIWNLRYGYFQSDEDAAGGFNDYDAHMVSTGLQIRF